VKKYVIWLNWPEKCFRANSSDIAYFKSLVDEDSNVVQVRGEKRFLDELSDATHVITWDFKEEWYLKAKKLVQVCTPGAGRELVAVPHDNSVKVHFGSYHGAIMAENVAAFILAWARGFYLPEMSKRWCRAEVSDKIYPVAGTKAVIAGYGNVGKAIGSLLEKLGIAVVGFGRKNLDRLPFELENADWFVMALPGTEETADFLNRKLLSYLPRKAVVINVGRGKSVDEKALLATLKSKKIAGAYLDVVKGEAAIPGGKTLSDGAIIMNTPLKELPFNLIRTPHSSAFSSDYLKRAFTEMKNDGCL
jgi:phosphoglycerate dehydrogenase-like enzyme